MTWAPAFQEFPHPEHAPDTTARPAPKPTSGETAGHCGSRGTGEGIPYRVAKAGQETTAPGANPPWDSHRLAKPLPKQRREGLCPGGPRGLHYPRTESLTSKVQFKMPTLSAFRNITWLQVRPIKSSVSPLASGCGAICILPGLPRKRGPWRYYPCLEAEYLC